MEKDSITCDNSLCTIREHMFRIKDDLKNEEGQIIKVNPCCIGIKLGMKPFLYFVPQPNNNKLPLDASVHQQIYMREHNRVNFKNSLKIFMKKN